MQALVTMIQALLQSITTGFRFLITFLGDIVEMIVMLVKLPAILTTVLQWTNFCGILPYLTLVLGLAVAYKILGRD